jgi:hypothetical protein
MAPMGVSPFIGLTNHGGVEALGLLCARCGGLIIIAFPEGSIYYAMNGHILCDDGPPYYVSGRCGTCQTRYRTIWNPGVQSTHCTMHAA